MFDSPLELAELFRPPTVEERASVIRAVDVHKVYKSGQQGLVMLRKSPAVLLVIGSDAPPTASHSVLFHDQCSRHISRRPKLGESLDIVHDHSKLGHGPGRRLSLLMLLAGHRVFCGFCLVPCLASPTMIQIKLY